MERKNLADLISVFQNINPDKKENVEAFVRTFFDTVVAGLQKDGIVKIKGFGTFKVVDVSARESVDVNTGNRIEISSHQKITFLPDPTLRATVNRPFACLQSVVIDDNRMPESSAADGQKDSPADTHENEEGGSESFHDYDGDESLVEKSQESTHSENADALPPAEEDDTELPEDPNDMACKSEKADPAGESPTPESVETSSGTYGSVPESDGLDADTEGTDTDVEDIELKRKKSRKFLLILIYFLSVVAAFCGGYFLERYLLSLSPEIKTKEYATMSQPSAVQIRAVKKMPVNKAATAVSRKAEPVTQKADRPAVMPVRKGDKYKIVGLRQIHILKDGEDVTHLAKQVYGSKDFAKYIIRYSGIEDPDLIHVGEKIKLPELEEIR